MPSAFFPPIVKSIVISSSADIVSPPTNIVPLVILPFGDGTRSSELRPPNRTDAAPNRFIIVCIANLTAPSAAFVFHREDVLAVYHSPHDPQRPVICLFLSIATNPSRQGVAVADELSARGCRRVQHIGCGTVTASTTAQFSGQAP